MFFEVMSSEVHKPQLINSETVVQVTERNSYGEAVILQQEGIKVNCKESYEDVKKLLTQAASPELDEYARDAARLVTANVCKFHNVDPTNVYQRALLAIMLSTRKSK